MFLKFKCLIVFSCFLITFCKHFLIETDSNNESIVPSTDNHLNNPGDNIGSRHFLIETDDKNMPSDTSDKDNHVNYPWGRSKYFTLLISDQSDLTFLSLSLTFKLVLICIPFRRKKCGKMWINYLL